MNLGATPFALINPEITWKSDGMFEVWDDCLSVPDRIVRVRRHRSISVSFQDELGRKRQWDKLPEHLSELVQHEIDHLDGILMTARAIDDQSVRPISEHATLVGAARPEHRLSLTAIAEAARVINPVFLNSPQFTRDTLSEALGCSLTLKVETLNPIKSFKGRGADYFVQCLERAGDQQALVCASAGNFGQGLAHACTRHGRPLTVLASVHANPDKVQRMRELGAQVLSARGGLRRRQGRSSEAL